MLFRLSVIRDQTPTSGLHTETKQNVKRKKKYLKSLISIHAYQSYIEAEKLFRETCAGNT